VDSRGIELQNGGSNVNGCGGVEGDRGETTGSSVRLEGIERRDIGGGLTNFGDSGGISLWKGGSNVYDDGGVDGL
jgi:hypothetical protein